MSQFLQKQEVYSFLNPLTSLSAEIEGRHYGGGVLELVPSEIEELLIPLIPNESFDADNLSRLNNSVKSEKMQNILEKQSGKILKKIGITKKDQQILLDNWDLLRRRRQRIST